MILVAFVLVLVATVMLIIGTFFDGGVAYIWISIGACVATFGVLAASYFARRRGADDEGARPQPLGAGESRPAAARSAPRGTTVGAGGTATATRERTESETDVETEAGVETGADAEGPDEESTVTIVPPVGEQPAEDAAAETADEAPAATAVPTPGTDEGTGEDEATGEPAAALTEPAPRRVAPRRVVRSAPAGEQAPAAAGADTGGEAAEEAPVEEPAPTWPSGDDGDTQEAEAPAAASATPQVVRRAEAAGTRKVVRRAPSGEGTRRVVRRAPATGGTRRVVRRAGEAQAGGQRTVRRVVRRAPTDSGAGAEQSSTQEKSSSGSGTRGKRARAVLSEIKGVGPAKQDALLKRFGSLEAMAEASVDELAEVKGVGDSVAAAIKKTLQDR